MNWVKCEMRRKEMKIKWVACYQRPQLADVSSNSTSIYHYNSFFSSFFFHLLALITVVCNSKTNEDGDGNVADVVVVIVVLMAMLKNSTKWCLVCKGTISWQIICSFLYLDWASETRHLFFSKSFAFSSSPLSWHVVIGDTGVRPKCGCSLA